MKLKVSDSLLMKIEGVPGPSLEKLLIDIRRDKDFDYLAEKKVRGCLKMRSDMQDGAG